MTRAREKFERGVLVSLAFHAAIVLCAFIAPSLFVAKSPTWGASTGGNGGVNVKIVSSMSGIALPTPAVTTDDAVVSDNKSLYKSEPTPKPQAPVKHDPAAVQLPSKTAPATPKESKAATPPVKSAAAAPPTPPAPLPANAVPYGQNGGNPTLRYGQTAPGNGPTGAEFGGDGTFGERYGNYVNAMTTAITQAWNANSISQSRAPRVYVTFTIARDGSVSGVQLEQQTNNPTLMERAAMQAVNRAKLPPLPGDYHGPPVTVRFYFDYAK
jgi:protein TonB